MQLSQNPKKSGGRRLDDTDAAGVNRIPLTGKSSPHILHEDIRLADNALGVLACLEWYIHWRARSHP